jgi:hypothetical protein
MARTAAALLLLGLTTPLSAARLAAQAQGDQATITLGLTAGYVGGASLWQVPNQPFIPGAGLPADTLNISDVISPNFGFGLTSTYYKTSSFGFTGELLLLGAGTELQCQVKSTTGNPTTDELCSTISNSGTTGSSVTISLGAAARLASHSAVSPFFTARGGAIITDQSTIAVEGDTLINDSTFETITVYDDPDRTMVNWYVQLAAGASFAIAKGYRLRVEARDNIFPVAVVTGPDLPTVGATPPNGMATKQLFSLMIGFDVVLERKRGRRY